QGAPVDVFISAAVDKMNALQARGLLLDDTRQDLLHNQVVLVVPKSNVTISEFDDLTGVNLQNIAIGDPVSVPVGKYAKEVLTSLGIFGQLQPKAVLAKDVRQVLAYVQTENVDAGIVYATDAKRASNVRIAATAPDETHAPVVYPIAVVKDSQNPIAATEFVKFLLSEPATEVFKTYGFSPLK
ncbi:MAG: molybdate ABC transporter substrate-binding protein, partial [Cyanothece sp. SIO1E1]|nr:molybdate ABC transporter substrate-binding protein [Cyanothece sp. SIO1E1]